MAQVLAISSQVARGSIGLSAVVPILQAFGHEVISLPTVLLSNHPGHARFAGEQVAPELLVRMLDALEANGWLCSIDAIFTGYLPSREHVEVAHNVIVRAKLSSPNALYFCDPILGDEPKGLYIHEGAAHAIREQLIPSASLLKMNRFECAWLSARPITGAAHACAVASALTWPTTIVTSLPGSVEGRLDNLHIGSDGTSRVAGVERRRDVPKGTGDVFAGLCLAQLLRGRSSVDAFARAVVGVDRILDCSEGKDELQLIPSLRSLVG